MNCTRVDSPSSRSRRNNQCNFFIDGVRCNHTGNNPRVMEGGDYWLCDCHATVDQREQAQEEEEQRLFRPVSAYVAHYPRIA